MRKRFIALTLACVMAASLAGCGGGGAAQTTTAATTAAAEGGSSAEGGNTAEGGNAEGGAAAAAGMVNPNAGKGMYMGTSEPGAINVWIQTMSVLNTTLMTYADENTIARHCWDALVKLDANNNVTPAAAESWESSEDGMKWTFHLRKDAKWVDHTGKEVGNVTANDFIFAWSELLNPENAAEYYQFATVFKNAQAYYDYKSGVSTEEVTLDQVGFKAVDDYTLEIELETFLPYFLQYMKFEVMSPIYQPFYEQVGADKYGTSPDTAVYNGPFYMSNWVIENSVTVEKNELWRDAANVELQKINFVKYTDFNARYNAFLGGELDVTEVTGEERAALEAEGFDVSSYVGGYSFYAWVNTQDTSDFRSANLRHAVDEALNRQQLIDTVFKNDNEVPKSFALGISGVETDTFSDAVVAENGGQGLYSDTANPDKAKEYLAKALEDLGYSDPSQIKISLMTSEGTQNELLSQVVQEQLRQNLGIEMDIEVLTITEWRARRNAKEFDFCIGGWGPDYNDPMTDLELMYSTNGNNHTGYANPEYDALIDSTKVETDPAAREKIFVQCELMIKEDLPIIPIYWRHEDYVASEKLESGYVKKAFQKDNMIYTKLAK